MNTNMQRKNRGLWPALFLIFIGAFFLLRSFHVFDWQDMWPLLLIGIGALLFFSALGKRDKGAVFPGTILLLVGTFFFLWKQVYLPWDMDQLWPVFPFIVGFAFFLLFLFNPRDWGVLIPAAILILISAIFFADNVGLFPWSAWEFIGRTWPVLLIVIGILILLGHGRRQPS